MYYKIKIKSQGSEFSLESSNKEVTQREMDLYFADMFGASEEFKSNIKKIEIVDQNIRTIKDFEQNKIQNTQSDNAFESSFNNKPDTIKFQNEIEFKTDMSYSLKQEQSDKEKEQPVTFSNLDTSYFTQKSEKSFFIEPFAEVEKKEENNETISEFNFQDFEIKQEETDDKLNTTTIETIQDIESAIDGENLNTIQESISPTSEIDELINKAQQNIDAGTNDTVDISSIIPIANTETTDDIQQLMQQNFDFNTVSQNTLLNSQTLPLDLKQFIKNYSCQSQEDELIVCAYFIKHILKESDFTIKYINSKLFQATGSIAGMSVIDDLVTKDYIRVININTPKTYSITTQGDIYFAELQG